MLVHEARQLLKEIKHAEKKTKKFGSGKKKKLLTGGAIGVATGRMPNKPLKKITPSTKN